MMAQRGKTMRIRRANQLSVIVDSVPPAGTYEQHILGFGAKSLSLDQVTKSWKSTLGQVAQIIRDAGPSASPPGFQLDQIQVALGVTAEGGLAFIAKAGVQATVTIVLKKS